MHMVVLYGYTYKIDHGHKDSAIYHCYLNSAFYKDVVLPCAWKKRGWKGEGVGGVQTKNSTPQQPTVLKLLPKLLANSGVEIATQIVHWLVWRCYSEVRIAHFGTYCILLHLTEKCSTDPEEDVGYSATQIAHSHVTQKVH